jgi:hypothetical protein
MNFKPAMTARQWHQIEKFLPETRRDRRLIEAVVYREYSGQSLVETAVAYGVSKARLYDWHAAIAPVLPDIMAQLKLKPAGLLARARGGPRRSTNDPARAAAIVQVRLDRFYDTVRAGRR